MQQFKIIHELHAGDVIYEKLTMQLGCVCLRVLSEPVRVEIDENTTCWDFTVELMERQIYRWNKEASEIELVTKQPIEESARIRNFRTCEQVANANLHLHKNNPLELMEEGID